jgi:putative transposase
MLFQNTIHVFEDLDREDLVSRKREKNRRKRSYRTPWKRIHKKNIRGGINSSCGS